MKQSIKLIASHTIQVEAAAVAGLEQFIDDNFENAVNAVHQCKGRLVVSGIGKSAIVGQKIVATLNSTGTPALFMHAADAIHGDLGMVQEHDVVLIISKSGESPEIKVLVPLIKNFSNTLIAMVGKVDSFLAKNASIILNTSVNKEACPYNLAPTSSTTAQMVMGDALAICLMELNNFTGTDFAKYHPGGNLGKRMYLRVEDLYVNNSKPKVLPTALLKEVILTISQSRLGTTAVVDELDKIIGVITDGDVRRMLENIDDLHSIRASDIQTLHPKTIQPDMLAVDAFDILRKHDISALVVADQDGKYLGILHLHDLVKEGII